MEASRQEPWPSVGQLSGAHPRPAHQTGCWSSPDENLLTVSTFSPRVAVRPRQARPWAWAVAPRNGLDREGRASEVNAEL